MSSPLLVWFRFDLRLADNKAFAAAVSSNRPVIPVYILDDESPGVWRPGGASRWWLATSLESLGDSLSRLGSRLVLRRGNAAAVLRALAADTGATDIFCNRVREPWSSASEEHIAKALSGAGIALKRFESSLLFPPETMPGGKGTGYRVFTPFWRACLSKGMPDKPSAAPKRLAAPATWPASDRVETWALKPLKPDWAAGMRAAWTPGEDGAQARLQAFLDHALEGYAGGRDRPDEPGVSRLSPHLRFGEIGPRQVWHAVTAHAAAHGAETIAQPFLRQLAWREFSYHLLSYCPHLPDQPLQPSFARFPWLDDKKARRAWQRGRTGYPLVDAGMRELWTTGWMHNRVRMVAASFLVKHLLQPWQAGEAWFWDTLVDADLANNAASWQWVAGCGADAAPYFRIFNPVLQGERFDPEAAYVRRWVPEIAGLPNELIHKPWEASPMELAAAGVRLGETYPAPIVDHAAARARALAALAKTKSPQGLPI